MATRRSSHGHLVSVFNMPTTMLLALVFVPPWAVAGQDEAPPPQPVIDGQFPGGNVIVDGMDGDVIRLRQDQRDTEQPWFYWHFRVRGAAGRRLTFEFTQGPVIGLRGPAVSRDGGATWSWLGAGPRDDRFEFPFGPTEDEVRFCFAIPYLQRDWNKFLTTRASADALRSEPLCRSKQGAAVERLRLGRLDGQASHLVLLVARHHACESSTGFLLEGLIDAALADGDSGRWLRANVEFWIVPFVDKDGVENGDQGKLRLPHDPWLDYAGDSAYPAVAALRATVPAWSAGRLRLAVDLHAPSRRDERIYFAGPQTESHAAQLRQFSRLLKDALRGPLQFEPADNLPFGSGWNAPATYGRLKSFAQWAEELPGVRLATTLELPYAQVYGREATPDSARRFGADLAAAITSYLRELP